MHPQNSSQIYAYGITFENAVVQKYHFYRAACRRGIVMRILSVRPSVTRVNCDKTEERSVQKDNLA